MISPELHQAVVERYTSEYSHLGTSLRPVRVEDAEFILGLRTNSDLNKFISSTSESINSQQKWISDYLLRYKAGHEAYFIIINGGKPMGTIRIYAYDVAANSATYGSWLIAPNSPTSCAFSSTILNHDLCFRTLKFSRINFDVRKENNTVWKFHESVGAQFIRESDVDRYYEITEHDYIQVRLKLDKLANQFYERPIS